MTATNGSPTPAVQQRFTSAPLIWLLMEIAGLRPLVLTRPNCSLPL
ncbi:hypothetical protein [Limnohabitans sp. Rim8]|nr:hypothetical protein [Limnohabitans sp. Rim8]